jgi:hypothetical protein
MTSRDSERVENRRFTAICPAILPLFETNCGTMWQVIVNIAFNKFIPSKAHGTADHGPVNSVIEKSRVNGRHRTKPKPTDQIRLYEYTHFAELSFQKSRPIAGQSWHKIAR